MAQMEPEDRRGRYERYPSAQRVGDEEVPREPTNAELAAHSRVELWPGGFAP